MSGITLGAQNTLVRNTDRNLSLGPPGSSCFGRSELGEEGESRETTYKPGIRYIHPLHGTAKGWKSCGQLLTRPSRVRERQTVRERKNGFHLDEQVAG